MKTEIGAAPGLFWRQPRGRQPHFAHPHRAAREPKEQRVSAYARGQASQEDETILRERLSCLLR